MNKEPSSNKKTNITENKEKKPQPDTKKEETKQEKQDPTKYGDWQVKGRTIDF